MPVYARRNDTGFYTWDGKQYRSVTTFLSHYSSGEHLLFWSAKMAAQDCELQLDRLDRGELAQEEAFAAIRNTGMRMRAAVRYRDFKGNVGSLVHHAIYHQSLGLTFETPEAIELWMEAEARKMRLLDTVDEETGDVSIGSDGDYSHMAQFAVPYFTSQTTWRNIWQPRFEMVGLEACIVSEKFGFAGTMDGIVEMEVPDEASEKGNTSTGRFLRAVRELQAAKVLADPLDPCVDRYCDNVVRLIIDFKTSKSISDTFRMQMEAYSRADFIGVMPGPGQPEPLQYAIGDVDGLAILHMKPDGTCVLLGWPPSDRVWHGFLGLMDCVDSLADDKAPLRVARTPKPAPTPKRLTAQEVPF